MRAGKLRHLISIEHKVTTRDPGTGDYGKPSWQPFAQKVWAQFVPLSSRDAIAAKAAQSEVVARVVIRYRAGLNTTMRIVYRGEVYSIVGEPLADAESGREYLTIMVSKGMKDG